MSQRVETLSHKCAAVGIDASVFTFWLYSELVISDEIVMTWPRSYEPYGCQTMETGNYVYNINRVLIG